jgi:hypothetical protein
MRTARTRRIGRHEADRLLAGQPTDPDHSGLRRLLAAAAATARPDELAGEGAILAEFAQAHRTRSSANPARRRHAAIPRIGRTAAKVTVGCVLVAAGGTAFAAETGALPDRIQQQAHQLFSALGVPAPASSGTPRDGQPGTPGDHSSIGTNRTPSPVGTTAVELCQAWDAARKDPHGKAMSAERLHELLDVAGGERGVPTFCANVLAKAGSNGTPSEPPAPGAATPSHPSGNGNGNGNDNGNGRGHPSPNPDH